MSKTKQMPGLRRKGGIWHIEKRCQAAPGGWLRESTGTSSRREAEKHLIRRLAEIEEEVERHDNAEHLFEEAGLRYLSEVAHKASADDIAYHLDQLFPFIGKLPLHQIHNGTIQPFIDQELARGLAPKSINNVLTIVSTVLNRSAKLWRDEQGRPWLSQAPATISRLSVKGRQARSYPLSWSEQDALIRSMPRHLADAVLFAINTGCREQEICQLRWSWEIEIPGLQTSVFVLPELVTKTDTERVIVLNTISRRVIESRRGKHTTHVVVRHMKCDTSPRETRQPHKDKKGGRSPPTTRKVMALWLSEVLWRSESLQQVRAHQKISCLVVDIAGTASQPFGLQYLKNQCTQSRRHNQQRGLDARRVSCGEVSHFMCRTTTGATRALVNAYILRDAHLELELSRLNRFRREKKPNDFQFYLKLLNSSLQSAKQLSKCSNRALSQ